jgi:mannosyltransferase
MRSKLNFEQVINVKNLVSLTLSEESKQPISIQSLALAGILTLAAILRFVELGAESFWQDEILSVLGYQRPLLDIVTERLTYNQPFYFLMLYFWAQLFGESEFSLRFPSAVFGVATVLATFVLARHLSNGWIALGAALLVAVSPALIWHSQEVRFYALTTFLLVGSTYFLIRYLEARRTWLVIAYAVIAFLGAYTHYYFLPFVAAQNLVALVWLLRDRRHLDLVKWLAAQLIVSLALIIRISTALADVSRAAAGGGFTSSLSWFLLHFAEYLGLADPDLGGLLPLFIAAWLLIVVSSVVAIWRRDKIAVLLVVCLVPLIQLTLGGIFFKLPIAPRYLVPTIPLWSIIICYGFAWLASQLTPAGPVAMRAFVVAGAALLLSWTLTSWGQQLMTPTRQQWRETAEFLENNALPSDLLVVVPPRHFKHLSYYLDNPGWEPVSNPVCQAHRRVWLVGLDSRVSEARRKLQQPCSATITTSFVDISAVALLTSNSTAGSRKDSRTLCNGLSPTILGSSRDERIDGTPGDDIIHGMGGNDRIVSEAGNDVICGGEGDDTLLGEDGTDTMLGDSGDDILHSGLGNDNLHGGSGTDKCSGRGNGREQQCEPVK